MTTAPPSPDLGLNEKQIKRISHLMREKGANKVQMYQRPNNMIRVEFWRIEPRGKCSWCGVRLVGPKGGDYKANLVER